MDPKPWPLLWPRPLCTWATTVTPPGKPQRTPGGLFWTTCECSGRMSDRVE